MNKRNKHRNQRNRQREVRNGYFDGARSDRHKRVWTRAVARAKDVDKQRMAKLDNILPFPAPEPAQSTALDVVEQARPTQIVVTTAPKYSREANRAKMEEFERRRIEANKPWEDWKHAIVKSATDPISAS
jgi:hypothetical protein